MTEKWVIFKSSRLGANRTYTGITWEKAGLVPPTLASGIPRHNLFTYNDFEEAKKFAEILSRYNPVGFVA